jgi:hypothetical protein
MMRDFCTKMVFITILFFTLGTSYSQKKVTFHDNVWLSYLGKNNFSSKWSLTLEASMRYANRLARKQQWFIRPSIDYQVSKKFNASVGYSYINNYRYGSRPLFAIENTEQNVWLQGTYISHKGKFKYTHRLRDENRAVAIIKDSLNPTTGITNYSVSNNEYRNRLRYLFLVNYTLKEKNYEPKWLAILGNEVFLNIGEASGKTLLNQNRLIAGLAYNINPENQIQIAYVHQNIWNFANTLVENNPTIRISYITNFDWY